MLKRSAKGYGVWDRFKDRLTHKTTRGAGGVHIYTHPWMNVKIKLNHVDITGMEKIHALYYQLNNMLIHLNKTALLCLI